MMRYLLALSALFACGPLVQAAPVKKAVAVQRAVPRDWTRVFVQTPEGVRMGNPAARVALIEYGSRTCPHCAHFAAEGEPALRARYVASGKVSFEFRDFPIHDALDLAPILLGRCVAPARFFALLDEMMAAQPTLLANVDAVLAKVQALPPDPTGRTVVAAFAEGLGYRAFAERHGVPAARARACLADKAAIAAIVKRADTAARTWKVQGTPTFIVGGKVVQANDWATLEPFLRAAGA